jgi:hypothetical protein
MPAISLEITENKLDSLRGLEFESDMFCGIPSNTKCKSKRDHERLVRRTNYGQVVHLSAGITRPVPDDPRIHFDNTVQLIRRVYEVHETVSEI